MTNAKRPVVALVTTHWGASEDESTAVVRLIAGALARAARVEVVFLDRHATAMHEHQESVFSVHHVPLLGARPSTNAVLRGALASVDGGRHIPAALIDTVAALDGEAHNLVGVLASLAPDSVVLGGLPLPVDPLAFGDAGPWRLVVCPLLADLAALDDFRIGAFLAIADAIGSLHPGEHRALVAAFPERADRIVPLDIALTLNRSATEQGLFGVGWFGRYVLAIRRFPEAAPRFDRSVTRELLRSVLGKVAIAEVDGTKWRVTDIENTAELPVNPTRVNLWRLMAHAEFIVDLRPQGPFGREAIESMLLHSPPIVPEGSAGMAHVEAANGGLWYESPGELLDLARLLLDDEPLRDRLRASGFAYSSLHHERMDDFVARMHTLVLGQVRAGASSEATSPSRMSSSE